MKKKYGKFYADWRDEHGIRHAKAFHRKKTALAYQRKMQRRAQDARGNAQAATRSRTKHSRGGKRSPAASPA